MAWSDAARAAAREARRLKGGQAGIEKRFRRTVRGSNINAQQSVKLHNTLTRLESKTDSWGHEKHSGMQIKIQDAQRASVRRVRRWRDAQNAYRRILGKETLKY